jgi:drug/metabolite transporter (DMT)-like permease
MLKDILPVGILSTANICLFFVALPYTTANAAAVIYAATPILTATLSPLLINERITKQKFAGIFLGLVGVLFILILPSLEKTNVVVGGVTGNILVFIAACSWALYTIGSRYLIVQKHYEPMTISAISISLTAVITLVASLSTSTINIPRLLHAPQSLFLVIHLALFATIGMYILYQYAIKHLSATTASLSNYIGPIFGFMINAIVLGERMTLGFVVGTLFVLVGVFLASSSHINSIFQKIQGTIRQ